MTIGNDAEQAAGDPPAADTAAGKIEALSQALVTMFGDDAPAVVQRQAEAATAQARRSWSAVLMCVNAMLARR